MKNLLMRIFKNDKGLKRVIFCNEIEFGPLAEGAQVPDKIKVVPIGRFPAHPNGAHEITPIHLQQMASNLINGGTDLLYDFGHESLWWSGAEAAGWSAKNTVEVHDDGLYIEYPKWTTDGQEKVNGRAFRYLSPAYCFNQVDKDGKEIGAVLLSVGLTNQPYMDKEVDHIGNDATGRKKKFSFFNNNSSGEDEMDSRVLAFFGLGPTATEAQLLDAVKNSRVAFKLTEDATLEQVIDAAKNSAVQGKVVVAQADYDALKADSEAYKNSKEADKKAKAEALVNSAIEKFKILPAMKKQFVNDAIRDYAAVEADLNSRAENSVKPGEVKVNEAGEKDQKAIANSVRAYMKEQADLGTPVSHAAAVAHVMNSKQ